MAINMQQVTLSASTATIVTIPQANEIPYEKTVSISVQNLDTTNTVYLGTSAVTSTNFGYMLLPGADYTADLQSGDVLYAIASAGTPIVAVLALEV